MVNGMLKNFFGAAAGVGGAGVSVNAAALVDKAPAWTDLRSTLEKASTPEELDFRAQLESGRLVRACAAAKQRLFDLPDGEKPRLTLYRDTASWCPYCEKVWLLLETKRVPYEVKKVNMNCYGDKPDWFWKMQPSGGIPVAQLDGNVIRESNDIMMAIEQAYPENPMLPDGNVDPEAAARVRPLLTLERELFSTWFRWLGSTNAGASKPMADLFRRVDAEVRLLHARPLSSRPDQPYDFILQPCPLLFSRSPGGLAPKFATRHAQLGVGGGPFFLGEKVSLVDFMFAPFMERMAASLPYYKGFLVRRNDEWPRVEEWFLAMEGLDSYRHIQSDFYTHVHDLPPQVGGCRPIAGSEKYADAIDGADGSWSLPLPEDDGSLLEPLSGLAQPEDAARREAAERLTANHDAIVRFAARGVSAPGFPSVGADLSDPNCKPNEDAVPIVDAALRHVTHALLVSPEAAAASLSEGIDPRTAASTLGYLRDRISVPRDMGYPAARQCRAHLNWAIETIGAAAAAK